MGDLVWNTISRRIIFHALFLVDLYIPYIELRTKKKKLCVLLRVTAVGCATQWETGTNRTVGDLDPKVAT
jgi:hypothetical protein